MSYFDHLIHRARIERFFVEGTDSLGQPTGAWGVIANDIRCRLVPLSAREIENATAKGLESVSQKVLLPPGVDVTHKDRIVINEEIHDVQAILVRSAVAEHHRTALV